MRYRAAHFGQGLAPADAATVAMDTAGKAVLVSGITVLISLSAVMLVPSPAFRSMALGIMVAVLFIPAATMDIAAGRARSAPPDGRQPLASVGALG